ncbi:hypothetical protein QCL65_18000 [Pseudomonas sp. nanlin1]
MHGAALMNATLVGVQMKGLIFQML